MVTSLSRVAARSMAYRWKMSRSYADLVGVKLNPAGRLMPQRDPVLPLEAGDFFLHRQYGINIQYN